MRALGFIVGLYWCMLTGDSLLGPCLVSCLDGLLYVAKVSDIVLTNHYPPLGEAASYFMSSCACMRIIGQENCAKMSRLSTYILCNLG